MTICKSSSHKQSFYFLVSASVTVGKEPSGTVFPLEGSKFAVKCIVSGTDKLPNATFRDRFSNLVEDSTDGHRKFKKEIGKLNEA